MKKDSSGVVTLLIKALKLGHNKMGLKISVVQLLLVFTNHQPMYIFTYLVGVENLKTKIWHKTLGFVFFEKLKKCLSNH
jgi:hypothetical protein